MPTHVLPETEELAAPPSFALLYVGIDNFKSITETSTATAKVDISANTSADGGAPLAAVENLS